MGFPIEKMHYTFADLLEMTDVEHCEVIHGELLALAAPMRIHQDVSRELFVQIANYLDGKKCKVYSAPFAVRLFEQHDEKPEDVDTVVEPDIVVVCDPDKLDQYGCKGAPDFIIEILSQSTQKRDMLVKLRLYQSAGVKEYWIVSPSAESIQVYLLHEGKLVIHEVYEKQDTAHVSVLDDCSIDLRKVFRAQSG